MKFVFVFPPSVDPTTPPLSISRIKGALEYILKDRIKAEFLDENYGFVRYVFASILSQTTNPLKEELLKSLAIVKIKDLFLNIKNYCFAYQTIIKVFYEFSKRFYPTYVGYATCRFAQDIKDPQIVLKLLESENMNPYFEYFYLRSNHIADLDMDVLCVSVIYSSQLVPALTIAYLMKKIKKDLIVLFGGPFASYLRDSIKKHFSFVDEVVIGEAEAFFESLKESKVTKKNLLDFIRSYNERSKFFTLLKYPLDYSWTDPNAYPLPEPVILLDITRGCYYKRCVFCSYGYHHFPYRRMNIKDVLNVIKNSNANRFFFSADVVDVDFLEDLAKEFIKNDIQITYCFDARLESEFKNKRFVDLLYKSGCRAISFGMESANQNTLNRMRKGINVLDFPEILENLSENNIHIQIHLIHGFPMEKKEEFECTLEFLKKYKDRITTVGISEFVLLKDSFMAKRPDLFGIKDVTPCGEMALECKFSQNIDCDYPSIDEAKNFIFSLFPSTGRLTGSTTDYLIYASYYDPKRIKKLIQMCM